MKASKHYAKEDGRTKKSEVREEEGERAKLLESAKTLTGAKRSQFDL